MPPNRRSPHGNALRITENMWYHELIQVALPEEKNVLLIVKI